MKSHSSSRSLVRFIMASLTLLAVPFVVLHSQAQIYVLTHNNSSVQINVGAQMGMFQWTVESQNQLYQQWFWYRVGNAAEQSIDTISAPLANQPNNRTLYTSYNNGQYGVEVDYMLTGFAPGSGISDISESITITNCTTEPLDFHFFQYSDFDLSGVIGGDVVQLGKNIHGLFNEAFQQNGSLALTETVATPGANHGEAGVYPVTLLKLNDAFATTLSDFAGPLGPTNATWAFQWDLTIAPESSVGISKDKYLRIIPEPTSILLTLGGFVLLLRRRR